MTSFLQVATTVETKAQAEAVARHVLEQRLAGCVQILPCASMYHWQGQIEKSDEFLCIMKTRASLFDVLQTVIAEVHPYEVPEILATPIAGGSADYLDWLQGELVMDS